MSISRAEAQRRRVSSTESAKIGAFLATGLHKRVTHFDPEAVRGTDKRPCQVYLGPLRHCAFAREFSGPCYLGNPWLKEFS